MSNILFICLDVKFCSAFFLLMPNMMWSLVTLYLQVITLSVLMVYFRLRLDPASTSVESRSLYSEDGVDIS